jgi:hypothetical protein
MNSDLKIASLEPTRPDHLKIRRLRRGSGFAYVRTNGRQIRESTTIRRLERLAVPPAYSDTRFAISPRAHIQAVGRDAAGRLQYRNDPEWERIRELRKARRLAKLIDLMPMIRRSITKILKQTKMDRIFRRGRAGRPDRLHRYTVRQRSIRAGARNARGSDAVEEPRSNKRRQDFPVLPGKGRQRS